jgi:hypothetical protein
MLPYGIVQMANTPQHSVAAFPAVTAAFSGGQEPVPPSPKPARRSSWGFIELNERAHLPGLPDFALRALPRVAYLADWPSLFALALIAEGVSELLPAGYRLHKENLS